MQKEIMVAEQGCSQGFSGKPDLEPRSECELGQAEKKNERKEEERVSHSKRWLERLFGKPDHETRFLNELQQEKGKARAERSKRWLEVLFYTDSIISHLLAVTLLVVGICPLAFAVLDYINDVKFALTFSNLINQIIQLSLRLGVLLLWRALHGTSQVGLQGHRERRRGIAHRLLSKKIRGHDLMAGGFAPRLSALSMGLLLFVDQTCLLTRIHPGFQFLARPGQLGFFPWPYGIGCRAENTVHTGFRRMFFFRLGIQPATGCYMATGQAASANSLEGAATAFPFDAKPGPNTFNLVHPWIEGTGTRLPDGTIVGGKVDPTRVCRYRCAQWRTSSMVQIVLKGGTILAGNVALVQIICMFTARCGAVPLITVDSSPQDVDKAIQASFKDPLARFKEYHPKRTCCLLFFILLERLVFTPLAPRIDRDGWFTQDYYATSVFLYGFCLALILRNWDPNDMTPIAFTDKLWNVGSDDFVGVRKGILHTVNLHDWFLMTGAARGRLLLRHARKVSLTHMPFFEPEMLLSESKDDKSNNGGTTHDSSVLGGRESDQWDSLRQSLLHVAERVEMLEAGRTPTQVQPQTPKGNANLPQGHFHLKVRCIKAYCGMSDVYLGPTKKSSSTGQLGIEHGFERCRVKIPNFSEGTVLGKTHTDQLMVAWDHDANISLHHGADKALDLSTYILECDPSLVIETNDEWKALEKKVHAELEKDGIDWKGEGEQHHNLCLKDLTHKLFRNNTSNAVPLCDFH